MLQIALQILGVIFLLLVLAVVAGVLVVRSKVRGMLRSVEATLGDAFQSAFTPPSLHLRPTTTVDWEEPDEVEEIAGELSGLGYHDAGRYEAEEVPGLHLWAFVNPSEAAYAVVYEHPMAGVWVDLVTRYLDGSKVTYTSAAEGAELDQPPGDEKVFFPDLGVAELHRRFLAGRPDREPLPHAAADFAAVFERAYAEEMSWRNAQGGPSERAIRAIAARSGVELSDEEIVEARESLSWQAMEGLDEEIRRRFLATSPISAADWEEARDRLVIVHDRLSHALLADRLEEWFDDEELEDFTDDPPPDVPPRALFAAFNDTLPPEVRFVKLGEVDSPLAADVYRASLTFD